MKKTAAIAIVSKLAPSAIANDATKTVQITREESVLIYSSDLGFFTAAHLNFNIADGNYTIEQLTKLFKLLGDSNGELIEGGCKVQGIRVKLEQLNTEVFQSSDLIPEEANTYVLDNNRTLELLTNSKEFMQKNNTVSRFIFDEGNVIAFDGARVYMTTAIQCEDGSQAYDPAMIELQNLQFELRPEHLEPLTLFLASNEDETVNVKSSSRAVRFEHSQGSLTLFVPPAGQVTTVAAIRPLFKPGAYYELNSPALAESLKNILALDTSKMPTIIFDSETQTIHNETKSISLELENSPIKRTFSVSGKFLAQTLGIFDAEENPIIEVYGQSIVVKTEFNKRAMLMLVTQNS